VIRIIYIYIGIAFIKTFGFDLFFIRYLFTFKVYLINRIIGRWVVLNLRFLIGLFCFCIFFLFKEYINFFFLSLIFHLSTCSIEAGGFFSFFNYTEINIFDIYELNINNLLKKISLMYSKIYFETINLLINFNIASDYQKQKNLYNWIFFYFEAFSCAPFQL
jgi:hypothetical protein